MGHVSKSCCVVLSRFNRCSIGMSVKVVHWDPQRIIGQPQAGMLDMRTTNISDRLCSVHDECCQATATSSLGKQTKRRIAAGRSHNVDPFHYITFFSIFPCGLLVLLKTNSRMRSTLEHGRRTRSRSRGLPVKAYPHCGFDSRLIAVELDSTKTTAVLWGARQGILEGKK